LVIASLTGSVAQKNPGQLIIDVHGVGYLVSVSPQLEVSSELGQTITLCTAFVVREDAFTIYGFESQDQLRLFETLRSVNGVGPKSAMMILSQLGVERISAAVVQQDDKVFSSVTGIGPKTAKLLTVTLEGKVLSSSQPQFVSGNNEVLAALVGLGWSEKQASEALKVILNGTSAPADSKELLRAALNLLANDRAQSVLPQ
jgi:Holliday junction DNA helicase RuvA